MPAKLINGKESSQKLRDALKERVGVLTARGITPGLAVVLAGENPASKVYVKNKKRACAKAGIRSEQHDLPADVSQEELVGLITRLNRDPAVHGILVQLPLPAHLDEKATCAAVAPEKDVDAFHLENIGAVMRGDYRFVPCTPAGVMELLREAGIDAEGRECVVAGRSNIVGKPMAMLLLQQNGTVTICHSRTKNLAEVCRRADILVSAVGKPRFITADMVKPGAAVIDVGINRDEEGRLCGDVDFEAVREKAGWITPVPGGVGPMTIAMLLENTVRAAEAAENRRGSHCE